MPEITIEGIQEAQDANLRAIEAMEAHGPFGQAIKHATIDAHAYNVKITHVDSGGLKASKRMRIEETKYRGIVFVDPDAYGPSGSPAAYGPYEEARGGSHASMERTVQEAGQAISAKAMKSIVRASIYGR